MSLGRRNDTKGGRVGVAILALAGSVGLYLAASTAASASTLDGVATIDQPGTTTQFNGSQSSSTQFTVALPTGSVCSGDTAGDGSHEYSYLVPSGTAVSSLSFSSGFASNDLGLVDINGKPWDGIDTEPTSGLVIGILNDYEWAPLVSQGEIALTGSNGLLYSGSRGVWDAGIACATPAGVLSDYWNEQVTFTASGGDPNGFVWFPGTVSAAPGSPSATGGNASATVHWTAPTSNGGTNVSGYDIYDSTTPTVSTSGTPAATASATAISAPVTGLTNGTEYYFVVTAVNIDGQSAASSPVVNATPSTVPGAPTSPKLKLKGKNATITWTDPASNGGSAITGYDIYESTSPTVSTSGAPKATVSGPTAHTVTIKKVAKKPKEYFVIVAVNTNGKSASSPDVAS